MSNKNNEQKVEQRAYEKNKFSAGIAKSIFKPESRGALAVGFIVLAVSAGVGFLYWTLSTKEPDVAVQAGGISTPDVAADAGAEMSDSYKDAKRLDNTQKYDSAVIQSGGVALPFTFNEEKAERSGSGDIETCGCVLDDAQLIAAMKRLGVNGIDSSDNARVGRSDIYLSTRGQLMADNGKPVIYKGSPLFMQTSGQLTDEAGIAVVAQKDNLLYLGKTGELIDQRAQRVPMLGDLHDSNGVLILGDGRMAMRPGNMRRIADTDTYLTREGQLATADGRPIKHSGANTYKNDENKLVSRTGYEIGWASQAVYQNSAGQLVNSSGAKFENPGIIFSFEGILIDNDGMLTRPLVNLNKIGESDIYKTSSGTLVDGYGLPITNYGFTVTSTARNTLVTSNGAPVKNINGAEVRVAQNGSLRVEVGKGSVRSGVLKQSDGVALDRKGQKITRQGRMERRGSSDIFVTIDGFIADKNGKAMLFNDHDTFLDIDEYLENGSQGLKSYLGNVVVNSDGVRVYLSVDGQLVTRDGKQISESGILTDSDGVLITSSGKKIVQEKGLERVVTKDGKPVTFNGKDVYRGEDGRLYDVDGNPILSEDGRAVFMDENGNLVDEDGALIDDIVLMAGERAVQNGELTTRRAITSASGEKLLFDGQDVFMDESGRLVDTNGNAILSGDGREIYLDELGNLVDKDGNAIQDDILRTVAGEVVKNGIVAGREQVVTNNGAAVTFNGQKVFRGHDGALYDESGKAILTEEGKRVFLDTEGNIVDEDGDIVENPMLKVAGERVVGSGDLITRKVLTGADGSALLFNGEMAYVGANGEIYDSEGNAVLTSDGQQVFLDASGNLVDSNDNLVNENLFEKSTSSTFKNEGGLNLLSELTGPDGESLYYNGIKVFKDKDGRLVDENGSAVITADGRNVYVDKNGNIVDSRGKKITESLLTTKKVSALQPSETLSGMKEVLGSDGKHLTYNGKKVYRGSDGKLYDENGLQIKTADGEDVYLDSNGNVVNKSGKRITEALIKNSKGEIVSTGAKLGKSKVFTARGKVIKYDGKDVYLGKDGALVDADGIEILTKDGKKIFMSPDGKLVDASGKEVDDKRFTTTSSNPVMSGLRVGKAFVKTASGGDLLFNGGKVTAHKDGSLVDANGNQILSLDGKKVFMDSKGQLVDVDGKKIEDPRFAETGNGYSGKIGALRELRSNSGQQLFFNGKKVFTTESGLVVDEKGNPVLTADGREVYINANGDVVDANGKTVHEALLTTSGSAAPELRQTQMMEELLDASGNALYFKGTKVFKGADGVLRDEDGNIVRTADGKEVILDEAGNLVDKDGNRISEDLLKTKSGKVVKNNIKTGKKQAILNKVTELLDANGNPLFYNGKRVFKGADGRLRDENGTLIKSSNGRDLYISNDGAVVDSQGNNITESILNDASGKPVLKGIKNGKQVALLDTVSELLDANGNALFVNGKKVFRGSDGVLRDEDGNKVLTKSGEEVYIDKDGNVVDSQGNKIDEPLMRNAYGDEITSGVVVGKSESTLSSVTELLDRNGKSLFYNGKKVYRGKDGKLRDENGIVITTSDGRELFIDDNGNVTDKNGVVVKEPLLRDKDGHAVTSGIRLGEKADLTTTTATRSVRGGELNTMTEVLGTDGKALFYNGKKVYRDSSGKLFDQNGNEIKTADGKSVYVNKDGSVVDEKGNSIKEAILKDAAGNVVKSKIKNGKSKVFGDDGSVIKYKGKDVYQSNDGSIVDENGNHILSANGEKMFIDKDGNFVNTNGEKVSPDGFTARKASAIKSSVRFGRSLVKTESGSNLLFNGKEVSVGSDGSLVDDMGNAILTKDGKKIFMDSSGRMVDADGKIIKDSRFTEASKAFDGVTRSLTEMLDSSGKQLEFNGKKVYTDSSGRVVDENGKAVLTADGREVFVSANGQLVDAKGASIKEALLSTTTSRALKAGELTELTQVVDSSGNALVYNGKKVFKGNDGRLRDEFGNLIKTSDGRDVYVDASGQLVDRTGVKITESLLKDSTGRAHKGSVSLGKKKLFSKSGGAIKYNGKDVYKADDGSLVDSNGNPILSKSGGKTYLDENGNIVDAQGNRLNDSAFAVLDSKSVSEGIRSGRETLRTSSGNKLLYKGQEIFKASDGSLVDINGNPILSESGEKIFLDDEGRLIDSSGNPVIDSNITEETDLFVNSGLSTGMDKLFTKDGSSVKYKGQDVFKLKDGSLVDSNGQAVRTSDGRKVYMNADGQLVDIEGSIIQEDLLTADGYSVSSGDITTKPAGEMTRIAGSDLFVTRDGSLLDSSGKAVTYNGKKVKVGKNGKLLDENGNVIVDKNGKPVFLNARGQLTDSSGKIIEESLLADGDGVLLDSTGKSVAGKLTRIGNSDIYKTADGRIVDENGRSILFNGEAVTLGDDGKLYSTNGKLVVDDKGQAVFLDNATGKLVDRSGNAVSGNILANRDGTLIDASGELVTSGGKLQKVEGTEYYKTENGQLVDSKGRPILIRGNPAFLGADGNLTNKHGSPIRFQGRTLYVGKNGQIVDRDGTPVTDAEGKGLEVSSAGGIVTVDGEQAAISTGSSVTGFESQTRKRLEELKNTQATVPANVVGRTNGQPEAVGNSNVPEKGRKPAAALDEAEMTIDSAGAERLQRRYLAIKDGMLNDFNLAVASVDRPVAGAIVSVGGTRTSGLTQDEIAMLDGLGIDTGGGNSTNDSESDAELDQVLYAKGGTFFYGISTFQFNTDFPSRTVVELVGLPPAHPFYGAKIIGSFELAYDHMVLKFSRICLERGECVSVDALAIDPATSAAGMGSDVNHHLWYRYGGLFVSSLLEGASIAASETTTREETVSTTGTSVSTSGLDGTELAVRSLGQIGSRFAEVFASRVDRPTTVYLNPGEEMSIVLFGDVMGPALEE